MQQNQSKSILWGSQDFDFLNSNILTKINKGLLHNVFTLETLEIFQSYTYSMKNPNPRSIYVKF